MAKYFLTNIKIEGFRGINNENDPLDINLKHESVNSIFASNAQGKSSIFEALCFAIKGYVPKLSILQKSEKADEYYTNQFHSSGTATIVLTFHSDDGTPDVVIRVKKLSDGTRTVDSPSGHTHPVDVLNQLNSEFCLLDYRRFTEFIEDSPLDRGRSFSALLGLAPISNYRQALEVLANSRTLNSDFNIAQLSAARENKTQRKQVVESQLRVSYLKLTGKHVTDEITKEKLAEPATTVMKNIPLLMGHFVTESILTVDFVQLRTTIKDAERSGDQEKLRHLSSNLSQLEGLSTNPAESEEIAAIEELIQKLQDSLGKTKGSLMKTHYESALAVLKSKEWLNSKMCPTCEVVHDESLDHTINSQLSNYSNVDDATKQLAEKWVQSAFAGKCSGLLGSPLVIIETDDRTRFGVLREMIKSGRFDLENWKEMVRLRNKFEEARLDSSTTASLEQQTLEKELPPSLVALTEQVGHAEQLSQLLSELDRLNTDITKAEKVKSSRDRWIKFITYATETFAEAEVKLSTTKTLSLEAEYRDMYLKVSNNADVVPKLVKAPDSESLFLQLEKFYGKSNLAAAALLSESYRNTLAISIFLSSALNASNASFIVLDDVTSSFDAGHQFNLMELIRSKVARPQNPNGPQVIILSHDGLLEKYFDRISTVSPWHHQRLQGLAPFGSVFTQAQDSNRLKTSAVQFLNAGQIAQAEPLVRQFLEFKLVEIIDKVRIPVPIDFSIRDDRRMVQNCIDAINSSVGLFSQAGRLILTSAQQSALSSSLIPGLVANWISHYSTGSSPSFTPQVLLGVLTTIDQLADSFKYDCSCSGTTVRRYYRTLSAKHCSC